MGDVAKTKVEQFQKFAIESQPPERFSFQQITWAGVGGAALSTFFFAQIMLGREGWQNALLFGGGGVALVGGWAWMSPHPESHAFERNREAKRRLRTIAKDRAERDGLPDLANGLVPTQAGKLPILLRYADSQAIPLDPQVVAEAKEGQRLTPRVLKGAAFLLPVLMLSAVAIGRGGSWSTVGGVSALWAAACASGIYAGVQYYDWSKHKGAERAGRKALNYALSHQLSIPGADVEGLVTPEIGEQVTRINLSRKRVGAQSELGQLTAEQLATVLGCCPHLKQLKVDGEVDFARLPEGIKEVSASVLDGDVDLARYKSLKKVRIAKVSADGMGTIEKLLDHKRQGYRELREVAIGVTGPIDQEFYNKFVPGYYQLFLIDGNQKEQIYSGEEFATALQNATEDQPVMVAFQKADLDDSAAKLHRLTKEGVETLEKSRDPRTSVVGTTAFVGGVGIALSTLLLGLSLADKVDLFGTAGIIGGGSLALVGVGVWLHRSPTSKIEAANKDAKEWARKISKKRGGKARLFHMAGELSQSQQQILPLFLRWREDGAFPVDQAPLDVAQQGVQSMQRKGLLGAGAAAALLLLSVGAIASGRRSLVIGGVCGFWAVGLGAGVAAVSWGVEMVRRKGEERRAKKEFNYAVASQLRQDDADFQEVLRQERVNQVTRLNLGRKQPVGKTVLKAVSEQELATVLARCPKLKQLKIDGTHLPQAGVDFSQAKGLVHLVVKSGDAELFGQLPAGIKRATLPVISLDVDQRYDRLKALKVDRVTEEGMQTVKRQRKLTSLSIREFTHALRVNELSDALEVLSLPKIAPVDDDSKVARHMVRKVTVHKADRGALEALLQLPRLKHAVLKDIQNVANRDLEGLVERLLDQLERKSPHVEEIEFSSAMWIDPTVYVKYAPSPFHCFVVEGGKERRLESQAEYQKVFDEAAIGIHNRVIFRKPSGDLTKMITG